jgi:hypothetical protein
VSDGVYRVSASSSSSHFPVITETFRAVLVALEGPRYIAAPPITPVTYSHSPVSP